MLEPFDEWPDIPDDTLQDWRDANPDAKILNLRGRWDLNPDGDYSMLKGITHLNIDHTNLKDAALAHIAGTIEVLSISNCTNITDAGFVHLKGVRELVMSTLHTITSEAFVHLKDIQILDIVGCFTLTDIAFSYITGVKWLDMQGCSSITDAAFVHLKGIETLNITSRTSTRDAAFEHLTGIQYLIASGCVNITDDAIKHLDGIQILRINGCSNITGSTFEHLKGIKSLAVGGCPVTDAVFEQLGGISYLMIDNCSKLTDAVFAHLAGIRILSIFSTPGIACLEFSHIAGIKQLFMNSPEVTDDAFIHLRGIEALRMPRCRKVTDAAFPSIAGVKTLDIEECGQLTDKAFESLVGIEHLNMNYCDNPALTDAAFTRIKDTIKSLSVEGCADTLCGPNIRALSYKFEVEGYDYVCPPPPGRLFSIEQVQSLSTQLPYLGYYTDEDIAGFPKFPPPESISVRPLEDLTPGSFLLSTSGAGLILAVRREIPGDPPTFTYTYSGTSRHKLIAEMKEGSSTYYECSGFFPEQFTPDAIKDTPYFAILTTSGTFYVEYKQLLSTLNSTHPFYEIKETGTVLAYTTSRASIIVGEPTESGDHCQANTSKSVYTLEPFVFEVPDDVEPPPRDVVKLKFNETSIEIPYDASQTIKDIRSLSMAEFKLVVPPKLIYSGRALTDDAATIGSSNIQREFTIAVVQAPAAGRRTRRRKRTARTK